MHTRREFLKLSGVGLTAATFLSASEGGDQRAPLGAEARAFAGTVKLGLASYTVRKFTLDQVLAMVGRLGLTRVALKDDHDPLPGVAESVGRVRGILKMLSV